MGKAVEQLRAQIAFFRVHGADQHEARRVLKADALALDHIDAHGRAVQQQIDHMVVQQVDLVDIEHAAVGRRQDARLEVALALLDRLLDVQRADHAIFGGAHRQIDEGCVQSRQRAVGRCICNALAALVAEEVGAVRVAVEAASLHDFELGQQGGQRTRRGRLGRAALAADQHAADLRVDGIQDQRAFHALLTDDG